jgi:hypothetical protein
VSCIFDVNQHESKPDMAKKPVAESTGKAAAFFSALVDAGSASTWAAASALTQSHSAKETTGKAAATAASKVLRNPKAGKAAKTAAASALTQKVKKKK